MGKVNRAIILTAGYGTRCLPITKALEKCMLPIGNRPMVDYVVEDCLLAGITEIMFVVGEQSDQIRTYYGTNQLMEDYLERIGKTEMLNMVTGIAKKARFHYVVQSSAMPYGTAVPLDLCSFAVGPDDQVLVASGDDFLYRADGGSDIAKLLAQVEEQNASAGMLVVEQEPSDKAYGMVQTTPDGLFLQDFIEEIDPATLGDKPFNKNPSKYLFDRKMFDYMHEVMSAPPAPNGEYQLTEALKMYAKDGGRLVVARAEGQYLNGGSTDGWLHANNVVLGKS
ncbi:MAG TPA: sugar phosphate nucleotidyltransferase [Candidatus Saccharimonadales bacterium]